MVSTRRLGSISRTLVVGLGVAIAGVASGAFAANLTKCDDTVNVASCSDNDVATHNCCLSTFLYFWRFRQFNNCEVVETTHGGMTYWTSPTSGTQTEIECTPTTKTCC